MPPTLRLSYLYILIFVLIPGYVCLRGYLEGNLVLDDQDRTDKFIVILIGGFASLCITVILHRLNVVGWSELIYTSLTTSSAVLNWTSVPLNGPVMVSSGSDRSVLNIAGILIAESGIAGILGFVYGRLKLPPKDREAAAESRRELRQPWEEAFKYATLDTEATVITTNGEEINGTIEQLGSPSEDYDILLADPHKIIRAPSDQEVTRRKIGLHSYHHYRDISRVEFESGFDYPQHKPLRRRFWGRSKSEVKWIGRKLRLTHLLTWLSSKLKQGGQDTEEGQVTSLSMAENGWTDEDDETQ